MDTITNGLGQVFYPHLPISRAKNSWNNRIKKYEDWMGRHGITHHIDEIAILFDYEQDMHRWVSTAVREEGVVLFNAAMDKVRTFPIEAVYTVEYNFLSVIDQKWRVEAMWVDEGLSPLHAAHGQGFRSEDPVVVHLSFKCADESEYQRILSRLANAGCTMAQSCKSDYGVFSYWKVPGLWDEAFLYLKPRVNVRDSREFGYPGVGGGRAVKDNPQA